MDEYTLLDTVSRDGRLMSSERSDEDGNGGLAAGMALDGVEAFSPLGSIRAKSPTQSISSRYSGTNHEGNFVAIGGDTVEQGITTPTTTIEIGLLNLKGRWLNTTGDGALIPSMRMSKVELLKDALTGSRTELVFVTETHFTPENTRGVKEVIASSMKPDGMAGVAILCLKGGWSATSQEDLIPGYLLWAHLQANDGRTLRVALVYGNNTFGKSSVLAQLMKMRSLLRRRGTEMVLGDWNATLDRAGREPDTFDHRLEEAIRKCIPGKTEWHNTKYTYERTDGAKSRIDRIFTGSKVHFRGDLYNTILSDHKLIIGSISGVEAKMGKGPRRMPSWDLKERGWKRALKDFIQGMEVVSNIEDESTLQKGWILLKKDLVEKAPKGRSRKTRTLQKELMEISRNLPNEDSTLLLTERPRGGRRAGLRALDDVVDEAFKSLYADLSPPERREEAKRKLAWARTKKEGLLRYREGQERPTKDFFRSPNGRTKTIMSTMKDAEGSPHSHFKDIGRVASTFYEELHTGEPRTTLREERIDGFIKERIAPFVPKDLPTIMDGPFSTGELLVAAKRGNARKSPGPDGIPFEWWRALMTFPQKEVNVTGCLLRILNSFQKHIFEPGFAEANMALLYKKGEKDEMKNYRPISLMNTDYKLLTHMLNFRLMPHAMKAIHRDQAGFIKGRHISEHIRLSQLLDSGNTVGVGKGTVLSLDAEKAYDRVEHDYLWKVLKAFGVPPGFIRTVEDIYLNAKSWVWINGWKTYSFRLKRGVRQGDPLSCLLFNYSLEPLGMVIRNTKRLKGIPIEKTYRAKHLKIKMFADDTQVFLGIKDKASTFFEISSEFRYLSGTKYNVSKSIALLVGGAEPDPSSPVPYSEGQERVLGAFVNDGSRARAQWGAVLWKMRQITAYWSQKSLSIRGRCLIAKALLLSRTLYLVGSSDIPPYYVEKIDSILRTFVWGNKHWFPEKWSSIKSSVETGGINMTTFRARRDAIALAWIRDLITARKEDWAVLAWTQLEENTSTSIVKKRGWRGLNPFTTKGYTYLNSLPSALKKVLQIAYENKLDIEEKHTQRKERLRVPLIGHPALGRQTMDRIDCLWRNRKAAPAQMGYLHKRACKKWIHQQRIKIWKEEVERTTFLGNETSTLIWIGGEGISLEGQGDILDTLTINPSRATTILSRPRDERRGWIRKRHLAIERKEYPELGNERPPRENYPVTVYTDGSSLRNGEEDAEIGAGAWIVEADESKSWRVRADRPLDNNSAEIMAIALAVEQIDSARIEIITDSKIAIKAVREAHVEERMGFVGKPYKEEKRFLLNALRAHGGSVGLTWVKGHSSDFGNDMADGAARKAINTPSETIWLGGTRGTLSLKGATLKLITQYLDEGTDTRMEDNPQRQWGLEAIREECAPWDYCPTVRTIQKEIWSSSDNPQEKEFLWKWFWNLLPEPDYCPWCGGGYSIIHIALDCGPLDYQTWREDVLLEDRLPRVDWVLAPILPLLSRRRDRESGRDRLRRKEIMLIAKAVNEEVQTWQRDQAVHRHTLRAKIQRRWMALQIAENSRKKRKTPSRKGTKWEDP